MSQWYVYDNNEVMGPYDVDDLEGKLTPDTQVCPVGNEEWRTAGEVDELESTLQPEFQSDSPPGSDDESTTSSSSPVKTNASSGTHVAPDSPDAGVTAEKTERVDPDEVEVGDLEPTLDELYRIAREASDEDLVREYNRYWHRYDGAEQKIIMKEITRRELDPETGEPRQV